MVSNQLQRTFKPAIESKNGFLEAAAYILGLFNIELSAKYCIRGFLKEASIPDENLGSREKRRNI